MSKLELRMVNYFMLIAFAAILIGIEFFFELDADYGKQLCSIQSAQDATVNSNNPLAGIRTKIMVMFGLLSVVIAIVLFMFMQNITIPVSKMVKIAKHINEGDLSQSIEVDKNDEISEVGNAINELASNLQEVASFTSLTASEAIEKIHALKTSIDANADTSRIITDIEQNLESLNSFVNTFKLLSTEVKNA